MNHELQIMDLQDSFTYDVYISFRGEDTRYGFTGHLIDALNRRGIHTFTDDATIHQGVEIGPSLVKAIEESRIAIIIFSKNYAFSTLCLDELTTIIEGWRRNGLVVLPVFYDVDPSDVRIGRGSYGEALARHEDRSDVVRVHRWRDSLRQAASLAGFNFRYGLPYSFILD
ncbi:hypothetical protein TSUD_413980 [Trifolium subterraneum]|uniref:TIR domain-containing protein n=1 Tax=Trifolium subterraneum TaxID=3900 RepID=A0A2Z6P533_TRISU|nr:hypothetical protein TSUD_413980 [Trifolium subterraneum]